MPRRKRRQRSVVRVEQDGGIAVFNFTVEGNHNYFVLAKEYEYGQTCVLVHNANCYGRRGSPDHVKKIQEAENRFTAKGWRVVAGGTKPNSHEVRTIVDQLTGKYRYADLILEKNGKMIAIQVGKATKNGPVSREVAALNDLRKVFDHVFFAKY